MKTEDVKLDVKEIFDKKGMPYSPADIAMTRYACRQVVEVILFYLKESKRK